MTEGGIGWDSGSCSSWMRESIGGCERDDPEGQSVGVGWFVGWYVGPLVGRVGHVASLVSYQI